MIFVPYTEENQTLANSYLSVEQADTLIGKQRGKAWKELDNEVKEMVLVQASLAIDAFQSYQYEKTNKEQILKFPRNGSVTVPLSIKIAVAMVAMDFSKSTDATNSQLIKREVISKFTTEYFSPKEAGSAERTNASLDISSMLKPLKQRTIKYTHGR